MNRPKWLELLLSTSLYALLMTPPLFAAGWLSRLIRLQFGLAPGVDVLCFCALGVGLMAVWGGGLVLCVYVFGQSRGRARGR